jgi:hypothetical protein
MFERFFQWGLKNGTRLLFGVAALILLVAVIEILLSLDRRTEALTYVLFGLTNAPLPLFCALVIQRLDQWTHDGGRVAVVASPPTPSWLTRHGTRLLFALSLVHFLLAALSLIDWMRQMIDLHQFLLIQGVWSQPLWKAGLLLFASLALDRLDRWLASFRPTYSD